MNALQSKWSLFVAGNVTPGTLDESGTGKNWYLSEFGDLNTLTGHKLHTNGNIAMTPKLSLRTRGHLCLRDGEGEEDAVGDR